MTGTASIDEDARIGKEPDARARLIDHWFPCAAVDTAAASPVGSGRNEKALFPWFASRPIAQARAAVLTSLLPSEEKLQPLVDAAIAAGDPEALETLAAAVRENYGARQPVVVDVFSGRGIIPLEAARVGALAVGTDLSPVATLAGRLLADWPLRNWDHEAALPFTASGPNQLDIVPLPRLLRDAKSIHQEIGRRLAEAMQPFYPVSDGKQPWGYLWVVTMSCDQCRLRFPLLGSLALRHPYNRTQDVGQSLHLVTEANRWRVEIVNGPPTGYPTYASSGRKGKSARCPFCQHIHTLEAVKAKGFAGDYVDVPLAVAEFAGVHPEDTKKAFRLLTAEDISAIASVDLSSLAPVSELTAIPDEEIPSGNVHTVMASGYGYRTFGGLMCQRQTLLFARLAEIWSRHVPPHLFVDSTGWHGCRRDREVEWIWRGTVR